MNEADLHGIPGEIELSRTVSELAALSDNSHGNSKRTRPRRVANVDESIRVVDLDEFLREPIPPREMVLSPWLLTQSLSMIYSWRGVGKTFVALNIAYAVASGGQFLKWTAEKPRRVLYIDGEMSASSLQARLRGIADGRPSNFDASYLQVITPDLQRGPMPDLATQYGQGQIQDILGDVELIIVDNISTLVRDCGRENDAESWNPVNAWALKMRHERRSVLFMHHSNKSGDQRGSSKKEDTLDTVLRLERPKDYSPDQGAKFEVHFEKARNGGAEELKPFEVVFESHVNDGPVWHYKPLEDSTFERVVKLANEGLTQFEISAELEINKSNVCRYFKRARAEGLLAAKTGQ